MLESVVQHVVRNICENIFHLRDVLCKQTLSNAGLSFQRGTDIVGERIDEMILNFGVRKVLCASDMVV